MGVFPATLCPFHSDESIDEAGLRTYIANLCAVDGLKGLVPNGHTGEIMSLRENERAEVTKIVVEEVAKSSDVDARPVIIVKADRDVPYNEIVKIMSITLKHELHVFLVTKTVEQ